MAATRLWAGTETGLSFGEPFLIYYGDMTTYLRLSAHGTVKVRPTADAVG